MAGDKLCVILGGGNHAKVLIEAINASNAAHVKGIIDPDPNLWNSTIYGINIVGGETLLPELIEKGVHFFAVGFATKGMQSERQRMYELGLKQKLQPLTIIHPTANYAASALFAPGGQLLMGSIVSSGVQVGKNVVINSGAIIEHDCMIGDHVNISSGVILSHGVEIGDSARVGSGSTVAENVKIAAGAIVPHGTTVTENID